MRERAKLMGGTLTVWTAAVSGTEIEIIIPAARAKIGEPSKLEMRSLKSNNLRILLMFMAPGDGFAQQPVRRGGIFTAGFFASD